MEPGQALPEVAAAEAPRREEEEQNRLGGVLHIDHARPAVGTDADDVARARRRVVDVGGDGTEPAQDLCRRLGHGTFDGAPGSSSFSSSATISTTLRPCPHQRHTTSST